MREILFKAKRLDNGEWVEGYLYRPYENLNPFIMLKNSNLLGYEVDPETVCQFTGLTDHNGVKIFECDKCAYVSSIPIHERIFHTVYWDNNCSQFLMKDSGIGFIDALDVIFSRLCVVIGNIHDKEE